MITLKSSQLTVQCKPQGAELISVKDADGIEYLWQADSAVWGRHAPVLFPIVGKLSNNQYRLNGKVYEMAQHGFARDREFEVVSQTDEQVVFRLMHDEETLKIYPYKFALDITYTLEGDALKANYTVYNRDEQPIFVTIGGHPGFTCPLPNLGKRSDYKLVFEQIESAGKHLLEEGNFNGETRLVLDDTKELKVSDDLFDEDALVFKDLASTSVTLQHKSGKRVVKMDFEDFPFLGIWSKSRTAPFVCIEPWLGLADTKGFRGDFSEKEGMHKIAVGNTVQCAYKMTFG